MQSILLTRGIGADESAATCVTAAAITDEDTMIDALIIRNMACQYIIQ